VYSIYNNVIDKSTDLVKSPREGIDLPLGTSGTIKGIRYLVTGYMRKNENGTNYHWDEYTLFNPVHGAAYLSQYDGHWMFLKELTGLPATEEKVARFEGIQYDLYSRYRSKLKTASGEFIYQLSSAESAYVEEYINPPEMLSKERTADNITWYKGEYIQPEDIKSGFEVLTVPARKGVGMIQPFMAKFNSDVFRQLVIFLIVFWGLSQLYFLQSAAEEIVFQQDFNISDSLNKKEIFSKSFDLKHGLSNAEVKLSTNVSNNWMYCAVTLVNEKTGDLYNVDLEAEYYFGYEGGENWSEGSNWVSKVVSSVPEGRYYLIIYSEKPTSMKNAYITVSVTRDVYIFSNGLIVLILLLAYPVFYFYRKNAFEKKRWYNSNYSPYDED